MEGYVAVFVVEDGGPITRSLVVKLVLGDGQKLKETKARQGNSNSKNAIRMRESGRTMSIDAKKMSAKENREEERNCEKKKN